MLEPCTGRSLAIMADHPPTVSVHMLADRPHLVVAEMRWREWGEPSLAPSTQRSARLVCLVASTGDKGVGLAVPKWISVKWWLTDEDVRRECGRR
jgi:hypothetical protein